MPMSMPADKAYSLFGDPTFWLDRAALLERAAEIALAQSKRSSKRLFKEDGKLEKRLKSNRRLVTDSHLVAVYTWLMAVSFELSMKAVLISMNEDFITSDEISTHNLRDLAKRLGILQGKLDQLHLKQLTEYNYWGGRYPVPLWRGFEKSWNQKLKDAKGFDVHTHMTVSDLSGLVDSVLTPIQVERIRKEILRSLETHFSATKKPKRKKGRRS
jgi:hypothetical protein